MEYNLQTNKKSLIQYAVHQKQIQYCKLTILQKKKTLLPS